MPSWKEWDSRQPTHSVCFNIIIILFYLHLIYCSHHSYTLIMDFMVSAIRTWKYKNFPPVPYRWEEPLASAPLSHVALLHKHYG